MRFLWVEDPTESFPQIKEKRFTRVCFGIISSMGHLGETINHHSQKYRYQIPEVIEKIENSLYVDNLSLGADEPKSGIELYKTAKSIFAKAKMNLREWKSSNRDGNEFIEGKHKSIDKSSEDTSYASLMLNPDEESENKVLEIPWNTKHDEFVISFRIKKFTEDVITKRELLKRIASIFDPVAILLPVAVPLKILFQKMCKEGSSWDDDINNKCKAVGKKWLLSARKTPNIVLPRCYLQKEKPVKFQIIGYYDASEKAYSAVTYLRVTYQNGQVSSQIIAAKTRVSPVKVLTIPRLELMSSLLLARLVHSVCSALTNVLCLIDSAITLAWIQNEKKQYKQLVQNRVRVERELTKMDMWYHLLGKDNIADLLSRRSLPEELPSKRSNWINGPSWLSQETSLWPIFKGINRFANKEEEKFIKTEMQTSTVSIIIATVKKSTISVENVIDPYRYSTLEKILSVIATCLQLSSKMSKDVRKNFSRRIEYSKELRICDLQKNFSSSVKFNKTKELLGVCKHEDGYLRCKGRLARGKVPFDTKLPILLPNSNHFTDTRRYIIMV